MGTRARIALQTGKKFRSIYVHWDGYPSHHGPILLNHYNTIDKINELLALGDLSVLGDEIGEKHDRGSKNPAHEKWCKSFVRDDPGPARDAHAAYHIDLQHLAARANATNADYIYLFTAGRWQVCEPGEPWQDLYLTYITEKLTA